MKTANGAVIVRTILFDVQQSEYLIQRLNSRNLSIVMKGMTDIYIGGIYLLKVNNRNTRTRCEICSKLTIKTPEQL